MTRSDEAKVERNGERRFPWKLALDEKGFFTGYCTFHCPQEIVGNGALIKCLDYECYYLVKLRPEGSVPKEGMMLQGMITPNKEIYRTEEQRQRIAEELRDVGELVRKAVQNYVQSTLSIVYKNRYEIHFKDFYSQKQRNLKGCPLSEYPKQRKEKEKRGGRKKLSERK
jgi:hypothetical protein